jgi:hypothetical protein
MSAGGMLSAAASRWLLAGVLLLSLALNATAIGWGLPARGDKTWSFDEIPPQDLGRSALERHGGRYPPLHYDLLRAAYAPLRWAQRTGRLGLDARQMDTALRFVGRSLSTLMALATVWLVYRIARLLLVDRSAALLAAALAALPVPFVRFAKTVNLDVPYTFWFALSLFFLLRALDRHRWRDYLALGAAMACAIGTKDQAAGLYLAVPFLIVPALGAELRRAGVDRPFLRAALAPRPLATLALALALFALVHRLFFGLADFTKHLEVMFGKGSSGLAMYPPSLAGQAGMALAALEQLAFSLGWPLFGVALAGIVVAARERHARLLALLALPVGYYLAFVAPIRYVRVRFLMPAALLLAIFGALALWRWLGWNRIPRAFRLVGAAAVAAYSLVLPVCLDLRMLNDTRYPAEAWLASEVRTGERWLAIANHRQHNVRGPRPVPWSRLDREGRRNLERIDADVLVVNRDEAQRVGAAAALAALDERRWNYGEVARFRCDPCRGLPDWSALSTNLMTVAPELSIFRKLRYDGPSDQELASRIEALDEGSGPDAWREVARELLEAPNLALRRELAERTFTFGVSSDRWTLGTRSGALLVLPRPAGERGRSRIELHHGAPPGSPDQIVELRTRDETRSLRLAPLEGTTVALVAAEGEPTLVLVRALSSWTPTSVDSRKLGVRIDFVFEERAPPER